MNDLDLCLEVVSRSCQSTIASHSPLNISETVKRWRLGSKGPPIGHSLRGIKWSRDLERSNS